MSICKRELINKINNTKCEKTLLSIFLILKANGVNYCKSNDNIHIDLNQNINGKLINYIDDMLNNVDKLENNNSVDNVKKLSYDINDYITDNNSIKIELNLFRQKKTVHKNKVNSIIYSNIMKKILSN